MDGFGRLSVLSVVGEEGQGPRHADPNRRQHRAPSWADALWREGAEKRDSGGSNCFRRTRPESAKGTLFSVNRAERGHWRQEVVAPSPPVCLSAFLTHREAKVSPAPSQRLWTLQKTSTRLLRVSFAEGPAASPKGQAEEWPQAPTSLCSLAFPFPCPIEWA